MKRLLPLLLFVVTGSCVTKAPSLGPIQTGDCFSYRSVGPNRWLVWACSEPHFREAMAELGCGTSEHHGAICTREPNGIVEVVTKVEAKYK